MDLELHAASWFMDIDSPSQMRSFQSEVTYGNLIHPQHVQFPMDFHMFTGER
jgi:hypothetical protein